MGLKTHAVVRTNLQLGRATLACGKEGRSITLNGRAGILQETSLYVFYIDQAAPTCAACRRVLAGRPHPRKGASPYRNEDYPGLRRATAWVRGCPRDETTGRFLPQQGVPT